MSQLWGFLWNVTRIFDHCSWRSWTCISPWPLDKKTHHVIDFSFACCKCHPFISQVSLSFKIPQNWCSMLESKVKKLICKRKSWHLSQEEKNQTTGKSQLFPSMLLSNFKKSIQQKSIQIQRSCHSVRKGQRLTGKNTCEAAGLTSGRATKSPNRLSRRPGVDGPFLSKKIGGVHCLRLYMRGCFLPLLPICLKGLISFLDPMKFQDPGTRHFCIETLGSSRHFLNNWVANHDLLL